jgi:2'-5' RNA ligase
VRAAPDERVRLFVALELPQAVIHALVQWRDGLLRGEAGLRAVPPASLHVTLCFLGWRPADEVAGIIAACGVAAALPAAALSIGRATWLPRRRPRVLAVELEDDGGRLGEVQAALSGELHAGGWYAGEGRRFLAHVTVARVGRGAHIRSRELTAVTSAPGCFPGSRVTVFRSRLSPAGARYERLASVDLRG